MDALLLELRDGAPPRVATIVIGGAARAERVGCWMTWLHDLVRRIARSDREHVSRVPFSAVSCIADTIQLELDGDTLESGHLERWLAERIVCRIPGGAGERK